MAWKWKEETGESLALLLIRVASLSRVLVACVIFVGFHVHAELLYVVCKAVPQLLCCCRTGESDGEARRFKGTL